MLLGKTIVVTGIASGIGARVGELAQALGADIIGVDINKPARPLGRLHQGGHRLSSGRGRDRPDAAAAVRRLCNVAGVSGMIGAAQNARDQLLWASGIERSRRAAAARGRRRRQCRLDRRLRLARQSRARESVRRHARVSRSRPAPRRAQGSRRRGLSAVEGASALVDDAGGASAFVQGPGRAGECGQPRPGDDADPQGVSSRSSAIRRVDDDIARVGRAGSAPDIAPAALFLCSDGARWINGANLPVDGGLEASINATVLGF